MYKIQLKQLQLLPSEKATTKPKKTRLHTPEQINQKINENTTKILNAINIYAKRHHKRLSALNSKDLKKIYFEITSNSEIQFRKDIYSTLRENKILESKIISLLLPKVSNLKEDTTELQREIADYVYSKYKTQFIGKDFEKLLVMQAIEKNLSFKIDRITRLKITTKDKKIIEILDELITLFRNTNKYISNNSRKYYK